MKNSTTFDDGMIAPALDQLREALKREYELILRPFNLTKYASDLARGKFFRSHLLLVAAGKVSERALKRCVALELLHTSTLVHDDIIDKATLRRDKPTLWQALGAEQALLIGNLIATRALSITAEDSPELCREFLAIYTVVNQAQQDELLYYGRLRSEEKYRDIVAGKTSAMLELALYAGASLSSEWPCDIKHLTAAIKDVGIVFQVKDDIEDVEAWLMNNTANRSKAAQFDIDLQNYTLPVTLAVRLENLANGEPLNPNMLRHISADSWRRSIQSSNQYADACIEHARQQLQSDLRDNCKELTIRITDWSENFLRYIQKQSLDEAVKHNVKS